MRRTTLGPLSAVDLNASALDTSVASIGDGGGGGGASRKSLSTSGLGRLGLLNKSTAPGTAKKAGASRPSMAPAGPAAAGGGAPDR